MSKREYIQRRIRQPMSVVSLIGIPAVAVTLYVQLNGGGSVEFWVILYSTLFLLSALLLTLMLQRLRCPDCNKSLISLYLHTQVGDPEGVALTECPNCHADFRQEMRKDFKSPSGST